MSEREKSPYLHLSKQAPKKYSMKNRNAKRSSKRRRKTGRRRSKERRRRHNRYISSESEDQHYRKHKKSRHSVKPRDEDLCCKHEHDIQNDKNSHCLMKDKTNNDNLNYKSDNYDDIRRDYI